MHTCALGEKTTRNYSTVYAINSKELEKIIAEIQTLFTI